MKAKSDKFRAGHKLEAVDLEHPRRIRVATITNIMGRVLQLFFDGSQTRFQFVESDSPDIHGFGWCKRTGHPLLTPYGESKNDLNFNLLSLLSLYIAVISAESHRLPSTIP